MKPAAQDRRPLPFAPTVGWLALLLAVAALAWDRRDIFSHLAVFTVLPFAVYYHAVKKRWMVLLVLLAVTTAAFVALFFTTARLSPDIFPKTARYRGVTRDMTASKDGAVAVTVALHERVFPAPAKIAGRIRLAIGEDCFLPQGARIAFDARIKTSRAFKNPGVFNWRDYLRRKNVWGQGFVKNCDAIEVENIAATQPGARLRENLYRDMLHAVRHGPILSALLLGTRTISSADEDFIRNAGLSHLFAISGMQFAVMIAIVYAFINIVSRLFPQLYLYCPRQKIASAGALLFVAFYLGVVLPQASVVRAGVMAVLMLGGILRARQISLLHILVTTVAFMLAINPPWLFDAGFLLSFLCLAILVGLATPLKMALDHNPWWHSRWERIPVVLRWFAVLLATSWSLNLLILPLTAWLFTDVNLNGLIHNLWAVPYFDFIVTPLSLAYLIAFVLCKPLAAWILAVWDFSLDMFIRVLTFLANWSWGGLDIPKPHTEHILLFYATVFLFVATRRKRVLALGAVLLTATLANTWYRNFHGFDLRITQIDVGQGDATLIQTPGKAMLVDAGGSVYFDIGRNVVHPFLKHLWLREIDLGVVTHADADHYRGFIALIERFRFREFWINGTRGDPAYRELVAKLNDRKIPVKVVRFTATAKLDARTSIRSLSPDPGIDGLKTDNDRSIVMKLTHVPESGAGHFDFTMLMPGDISRQAERLLTAHYGMELDVDVLKVAHHGSKTSSSAPFLGAVSPKLALIGVGEQSQFGHPRPEVLDRLTATGALVYRTDLDGAITLTLNHGRLAVETFTGR